MKKKIVACFYWPKGKFVFVLFVGIKPEKLYSTSCFGREVNPLEIVTHGQRNKPRACQRQRCKPRTCQSMVNTLQVDGLARITGLSGSYSTTHPQPPNGVPPCLVCRIGFGRGKKLNDERFGGQWSRTASQLSNTKKSNTRIHTCAHTQKYKAKLNKATRLGI